MSIRSIILSLFGLISKRKLNCLQYNRYSDEISYCLNYHDAVNRYILKFPDLNSRLVRLELFERFFKQIKDYLTISCIIQAISNCNELTDFHIYFDKEHQDAQNRFSISSKEKTALILCGFKHALRSANNALLGSE